jgi:hypothetical protein
MDTAPNPSAPGKARSSAPSTDVTISKSRIKKLKGKFAKDQTNLLPLNISASSETLTFIQF